MTTAKVFSQDQLDLLFKEAEERLREKSQTVLHPKEENEDEIILEENSFVPQKRKPSVQNPPTSSCLTHEKIEYQNSNITSVQLPIYRKIEE